MSVELTVIVKSSGGKTVEGASVVVTPGDVTGKTDSKGEVTLRIDGANKYDVTVSDNGITQTVPYYSLKGKNTARLEVDLAYLKQRESQQQTVEVSSEAPAAAPFPLLPVVGSAAIVVALLLTIALLKRRQRAAKKKDKKRAVKKRK